MGLKRRPGSPPAPDERRAHNHAAYRFAASRAASIPRSFRYPEVQPEAHQVTKAFGAPPALLAILGLDFPTLTGNDASVTRGLCHFRQPTRRRGRPSRASILRASWVRFLAGAFALLLHVSRIVEPALVDHVVCEHSELAHTAPESSSAPAAAGDAGAGEPKGEQLDVQIEQGNARGGEGAEHDHCTASTLHHRIGDIGPSCGEASLLEVKLPPSGAGCVESRPIDILLLAPKASPPLA